MSGDAFDITHDIIAEAFSERIITPGITTTTDVEWWMRQKVTDMGLETTSLGVQVLGGHGFIREWGMEQLMRDVRIAMLYEGTNGIQALDLVGRKLALKGGQVFMAYVAKLRESIEAAKATDGLADMANAQAVAVDRFEEGFKWFMENALNNFDHAGAGSVPFMHMFGLVALGHMWVRMAVVAAEKKGDAFYDNKLITARFFMARMLPDTAAQLEKIKSGADVVMALAEADF